MPTNNEHNSGTSNKSPDKKKSELEEQEQALLSSFNFDPEETETVEASQKIVLPPIRRSKMSNKGAIEKIEKQRKQANKEALISTAKKLLERAGTSIEELANSNKKVPKGFSFEESTNNKSPVSEKNEHAISEAAASQKNKDNDPFAELDTLSEQTSELEKETFHRDESFLRKKTTHTYKKGFFHYVGIISCISAFLVISFFVYKFINSLISEPIPTVDEVASVSQEEAKAAKEVLALIPIKDDSQYITDARQVVKDYFTADSKRFAYSFVNSSPDLHSAFNKHWKAEEEFDPSLLIFNEGFTLPDNSHWVSFYYGSSPDQRRIILTKKKGENFKIDWQTMSEIETMTLGDLAQEATTDPFSIRAWVSPGEEYPNEFSSTHWQCFIAHDIRGQKLLCYTPKKTSLHNSIQDAPLEYFKSHPVGGKKGLYVKLLVHKPQIGAEYVKVIDVISTSWHENVDALKKSLPR